MNARRGTQEVPWTERITFDLNNDEGKTWFVSPNGIIVNWFLIHHAAVVGRGKARVTIFNARGGNREGKLCRMWDLISPEREGSFDEVERVPRELVVGFEDKKNRVSLGIGEVTLAWGQRPDMIKTYDQALSCSIKAIQILVLV
ncbi:MAG: hypothetical protein Q9172_002595 [Xanthocarpia lactea]